MFLVNSHSTYGGKYCLSLPKFEEILMVLKTALAWSWKILFRKYWFDSGKRGFHIHQINSKNMTWWLKSLQSLCNCIRWSWNGTEAFPLFCPNDNAVAPISPTFFPNGCNFSIYLIFKITFKDMFLIFQAERIALFFTKKKIIY